MTTPDSEPFALELTGMAHGGYAIGRHAGRAIFVPYALPGEKVLARLTQDRGRFAHAEVLEIIASSPDRITPLCPHFGPGKCGGCQWQHISYEAQLRLKTSIVRDQLQRIGGIADPVVHPTIP